MYNLKMTQKQSRIVVDALDFYSRIHCRQMDEILFMLRKFYTFNEKQSTTISDICSALGKVSTDDSKGVAYGIRNHEVHEDAKVAYDVQQVLRKAVADSIDDFPKYHVWNDPPLQCSQSLLATADFEKCDVCEGTGGGR